MQFLLLLYVRVRALFSFRGNPATSDAFEATTNRYSTDDSELGSFLSLLYAFNARSSARFERENSFLRFETRPLNPGSVQTKISQLIFRDELAAGSCVYAHVFSLLTSEVKKPSNPWLRWKTNGKQIQDVHLEGVLDTESVQNFILFFLLIIGDEKSHFSRVARSSSAGIINWKRMKGFVSEYGSLFML